jgi:hypothetical protein
MLAGCGAYWHGVKVCAARLPVDWLDPPTVRRGVLPCRSGPGLRSGSINTEPVARLGRRGARLGLAAVLLAALVACTGEDDPSATPTPTPSPTATSTPSPTPTTPPLSAEDQAALQVYRQFWDAVAEARAIPDPANKRLPRLASGTALTDEQAFLFTLQRQGVVFEGGPKLDPEITDREAEPVPSVTVTDCIDSSDWRSIRVATGESAAAPGQETRFYTVTRLEKFDDQWLVFTIETDRSRTC